jgi:hypothetical protein
MQSKMEVNEEFSLGSFNMYNSKRIELLTLTTQLRNKGIRSAVSINLFYLNQLPL